jgi:hypothetical protein
MAADHNDLTRPDADLTKAYQLFGRAGDRGDYGASSTISQAERTIDALCGIGHVLLAIEHQLADTNDQTFGLTEQVHAVADQLGDLAGPADRLASVAEDLTSRPHRWFRRHSAAQPVLASQAAESAIRWQARRWRHLLTAAKDAAPVSDSDVLTALTGLWSAGAWRRLEIYRAPAGGIGGYCILACGIEVSTADALADPAAYPGVAELAALFIASGWQRFEILGDPVGTSCGGWCERADGSGINVPDCRAVPGDQS